MITPEGKRLTKSIERGRLTESERMQEDLEPITSPPKTTKG